VNIAQALKQLFPQANPLIDFVVQDDCDGNGPYIAVWNLDEPQPTEEELQSAWEEYQQNPPPSPETQEQKVTRLESENADLLSRVSDIELAFADIIAGGGV
jgi:hypothetical protein